MSQGRLFELLYLLLEQGAMPAPRLAERLEVSVRTIYRDVDALSAAGVPVYATRGRGGGVALMDHFVLSRAAFSEEEQRQLLTALQSLAGDPRLAADETLSKLSALFRRQEPPWLQVDLSRWGAGQEDRDKFDRLRDAILARRAISFSYASAYGRTSSRRVLPARLAFKGQAWYLQGFCLDRQDYRTFKVCRMRGLSVEEEPFHRPLAPPPLEPDPAGCPSLVEVRLRLSPALAYRAYDEFDGACAAPQEDGTLVVTATLPEDPWLYGYLLSFGPEAEVLSPPHVRRELARLAQEIWQNYQKPDSSCQVCCATIGPSQQQEEYSMEQQFCQSCGMPLTDALRGTESDGTPSPHYCTYCYQKGAFTGQMTMEQMIDFCVPHMVQANPDLAPEEARARMAQFFPTLLRWRKDA